MLDYSKMPNLNQISRIIYVFSNAFNGTQSFLEQIPQC